MRKYGIMAAAIIMGIVLLLAGCPGSPYENGTINGFIEDQDGNPVADVTVTVSVPDEPEALVARATVTATTDEYGHYEINDLVPGEYVLAFGKEGFTRGTAVVDLQHPYAVFVVSTSGGDSAAGEYTNEVQLTLFAKIASATGQINIKTAAGTGPAVGVPVNAVFDGKFAATVNTDANGIFSFTGLPAGPVAFYAPAFFDGTVFYNNLNLTYTGTPPNDTIANTSLIGRSVSIAARTWEPYSGTTPVVASSNLSGAFEPTDDLSITFNKNITSGDFTLTNDGSGADIYLVATIANNVVTLAHPEELLVASDYTLDYSVIAADGYAATGSLTLTTVDGIEFITSNIINLDGSPMDDVAVNSNVTLIFSQPIINVSATNNATIALRQVSDDNGTPNFSGDDTFSKVLDRTVAISADGMTLTIDPVLDFENYKTYSIQWTVKSAYNDGTDANSGYLQFDTVEETITAPGNVTSFSIYDPTATWDADWNTTSVPFSWSRVTGADGYLIFAQGSVIGTDRVLVHTEQDPGPNNYVSTMDNIAADLTGQFDGYDDPTMFPGDQPFALGNVISFTIFAYKRNEAGTVTLLSAASPTAITVEDEVNPSVDSAEFTQPDFQVPYDATAGARTMIFVINSSEAITSTASASIDTWQAGDATVRPSISSTVLNSRQLQITMVFDNDVGVEDEIRVGDTLQVTWTDLSLNTVGRTYTFVATP